MYKIADKFKDTKVFYFTCIDNKFRDYSQCSSYEDALEAISRDYYIDDEKAARLIRNHIFDAYDDFTDDHCYIDDAICYKLMNIENIETDFFYKLSQEERDTLKKNLAKEFAVEQLHSRDSASIIFDVTVYSNNHKHNYDNYAFALGYIEEIKNDS